MIDQLLLSVLTSKEALGGINCSVQDTRIALYYPYLTADRFQTTVSCDTVPQTQSNRVPRAQSVSALRCILSECMGVLYCKKFRQTEEKYAPVGALKCG